MYTGDLLLLCTYIFLSNIVPLFYIMYKVRLEAMCHIIDMYISYLLWYVYVSFYMTVESNFEDHVSVSLAILVSSTCFLLLVHAGSAHCFQILLRKQSVIVVLVVTVMVMAVVVLPSCQRWCKRHQH